MIAGGQSPFPPQALLQQQASPDRRQRSPASSRSTDRAWLPETSGRSCPGAATGAQQPQSPSSTRAVSKHGRQHVQAVASTSANAQTLAQPLRKRQRIPQKETDSSGISPEVSQRHSAPVRRGRASKVQQCSLLAQYCQASLRQPATLADGMGLHCNFETRLTPANILSLI